MGSSSQVLLFFFLLLLLLLLFVVVVITGEEICSTSACIGTEPAIRFPFRIQGLQPNTCGYPGFDLSCNNQSKTILEISSSGGFWLQDIDYMNQEIRVNDQDGCLPKRLLSGLDLLSSPFRSVYYENYTILRCSTEQDSSMPPNPYKHIICMSNSTYEVWATASWMAVETMLSRGCHSIATVAVPIPWPGYYENDDDFLFSDLSENLTLTWDVPECGDCEAKGGRCGFKSSSSLDVECFGVSRHGLSRSVSYAVTIGVGVPALLCGIGIVFYVTGRVKSYRRHNSSAAEVITAGSSSTANPQPTIVVMGLDNPTIESYPKAVLGESCRLPEPNDSTCPICISEYEPGETLRTIPQCQHCFHADCIDAWLKMKVTCPLCRTSPETLSCAYPP